MADPTAGLWKAGTPGGLSKDKFMFICLFFVATTQGPSWLPLNILTYQPGTGPLERLRQKPPCSGTIVSSLLSRSPQNKYERRPGSKASRPREPIPLITAPVSKDPNKVVLGDKSHHTQRRLMLICPSGIISPPARLTSCILHIWTEVHS